MENTYKTLAQFLGSLKLTEQQLKSLTGISIKRLRAIYKNGDFTDDELIKLIKALTGKLAVRMLCASQIGNFNQNGIGNQQTIINNFFTIMMRRLAAAPGVAQPRVLPIRPTLVESVQQQAFGQLPGSQATPAIGGFAPIGPQALVA